jgi:hypothetical protein
MAMNFTAAHWRDRAEEARAVAMALTDEKARQDMLAVASQYEKLAAFTEKLQDRGRKPIDPNSTRA